MKFLGQFIQDFIARFRNDVYLEDVDSGTIASGSNLGLDSNNKIVKASIAADVNTTYGVSCVDGDNSDEEKIRLTGSDSSTDDIVLEAGTGLSIARSGDKITFTNTVTDTDTVLTTEQVQDIAGALVATGGTKTLISVTYDDANNNMDFVVDNDLSNYDNSSSGFVTSDTNTQNSYAISCVDGDNSDEEKIRLTQSGADGAATDDVVLEAGTGLSIARSGDKITFTNTVSDTNTNQLTEFTLTGDSGSNQTIAHGNTLDIAGGNAITTEVGATDTVTINHDDTSSQASVNNSGRTYIQDITLDTYGHVTGLTSATETVTDTNTMGSGFTVSATTDTNATTITQGDDLFFAAGTGITCETTADGTVTITNTVSDTNTQLSDEQVQDIVGGMVTGNTESGITVAYQDGDGTLDFTVGTLNQDTTGNAATATALETARNIGGVSFDGTGNINLPGVNTAGDQDTTGNAATATKLAATKTIAGVAFDGSANISLNNNAITNGAGYTTNTGDITGVTITTDSGSGSAASDTAGSADFSILGSSGVGVTNSGTTITAVSVPGEIDHDSLLNFVAAEHYRWDTDISATATINAANIPTLNQDTTGEAGTVATIAGLAPNTATTQATQPNITTLAGLTSFGAAGATTDIAAGDLTMYNAVNNGNPSFSIGSSATNRLVIQPVYNSGAQTVDYVEFNTFTTSSTNHDGRYFFKVDEVEIARLIDTGALFQGLVQTTGDGARVVCKDTDTSSTTTGAELELRTDDGAAMANDHRLGIVKFTGAEDASNTITTGAQIEAFCDAAWSASENGSRLVFSTTDGNASTSEVLRLDSNKLATFAGAVSVTGNLTFDSVGLTAIQTSSESFADNDTSLMTSAAIDDRINAAVAEGGGGDGGNNIIHAMMHKYVSLYLFYINTVNYWYTPPMYNTQITTSATIDGATLSAINQAKAANYIAPSACKVKKVTIVFYQSSLQSGDLDMEFALVKWTPADDTANTASMTEMTITNHDGAFTETDVHTLNFTVTDNSASTLAAKDCIAFCARITSGAGTVRSLVFGQGNFEIELT